jgi:hypothetical protein
MVVESVIAALAIENCQRRINVDDKLFATMIPQCND